MTPHTSARFLVDFGRGDPHGAESGFCEVVFPELRVDPERDQGPASAGKRTLTLRRGFTGALDLYRWWAQARKGKAPQRRHVTVSLLASDGRTVVANWRFAGIRPVALAYSPLNANESRVLIETIELEFDGFEMR
jgi:phage tail-like protein